MEAVEVSDSKSPAMKGDQGERERDQLRVKRKTLQAVLDQCQKALELINNTEDNEEEVEVDEDSLSQCNDSETAELCDLLKSRVESPNFLEKLGSVHVSVTQNMPGYSIFSVIAEEGSSWDMVSENDLWDDGNLDAALESDQEGYVLVRQEDIVEGIACFMAAYLLSLKETKELTPNQLQEALSKTFSVKKRKGKLRKAWDGSKVLYNVASWGATAIGIYQNPALLRAASLAFWNSCHVISKLF